LKLADIYRWIQTKIHKTQDYYRKFGLWKTILNFLDRRGIFKRKVFIFLERELKDSISGQEAKNSGDLVRVEKEDLKNNIDKYLYEWFEKDKALKRLEAGNVLLVVKDGEKMIYYEWLEFAKVDIPYLDLSFLIPDGIAYVASMYTEPEYRRRGIASKAKPLVYKYLRERGCRRTFCIITPDNEVAQRINKKVGYKEYQTVIYWRLLFLKYYCVKGYHTGSQKVYWGSGRATQELWRTFSKIGPD
jgi:ribosomal protein S18 acetylase RimI-like enzyme